ncbi:MAG: hypothetical protein M1839_000505 [Geoglossum umbratile]|nr:MAG: hypothetical protein M1839_000505 [Geoglossum umbratile]
MSDVREDIPEVGGVGKSTRTPDRSSESKKRAPPTPTKPAHLRRDSKATAHPQLAFVTSPVSPKSTAAGLEIDTDPGALPPSPRKKPAVPAKHDGLADLPPLPDWAQSSPSSTSTGSSWKGKGKAVLGQIPSTLKKLPGAVSDKFKPATQSAPSFVIAIMGVTGSGKSQFIKHVTGKDVKVSSSLNSCTAEIGCYATWIGGVCVTLIDTPGFDDTNRSEINVLETIACFLEAECKGNLVLNGIIYLHRITNVRMGGASARNLRMFRTLCGEDCLPNVLLVTSMWDTLLCLPNGQELGEQREAELIEKPEFWGAMTQKGAKLQRHDGTKARALEIVESMMGMGKITTAIQKQLAEGVILGETDAGRVVNMMNTEKVNQLKADAEEHIKEQKKINESLRKEMQEAKDKFEQFQHESQQARQQAEEVQRQQLSVSEERKRELDGVMKKLRERADKADMEAEVQKKKVQEKRDEAAQALKDIDGQVNSVNKAIAEREAAAERLKMNVENRKRFWLMGAAQTIGPMIEGFLVAGPMGAAAVAGVSIITNLLAGFAMF